MSTARGGSEQLRGEILKAVAPFLKRHGTGIASVDKIMKAAGFTSGALYSQFKNKDDLCTEAICSALDVMLEAYGAILRARGKEGLKLIVSQYLSPEHIANVPKGCTFAALGSDMARGGARAKRAYEARIQAVVQLFANGLGTGPEPERRATAQRILSAMVGAMTLARAMNDETAANELLSQVRKDVLRQLDEKEERS